MKKKSLQITKDVFLTLAKVLWLPCLLIIALAIGLYIGYDLTSDNPAEIFSFDLWKNFFNQLFGS